MMKTLEIPFTKLHGLGNDFIVVSAVAAPGLRRAPAFARAAARFIAAASTPTLAALARGVCDRHTGVGADGLIALSKSEDKSASARMRIFNADGSEAEMSGNGIRCAGACLHAVGAAAGRGRRLSIVTAAGVKSLELVDAPTRVPATATRTRWVFRVGMGAPILEPAKVPFDASNAPAPVVGFPLRLARGTVKATITSMGNPHCAVFVDDFDSLDWASLGREIETSRYFPNRTNVEFVKPISRSRIAVRFWERGVGVTQSSGTGSCSAVVASILNGLTGRRVRVSTVAGNLEVEWPSGGEVALIGPTEMISSGVYYFAG